MTEEEWLSGTKVTQPVVRWLRRYGSDRKFYLAGAAAVRHIKDLLTDTRSHDAITVAERFADGEASLEELDKAFHAACTAAWSGDASRRGLPWGRLSRSQAAATAAGYVASPPSKCPGSIHLRPEAWVCAYYALLHVTKTGKRAEMGVWQTALLRDIFGNPFRPVTMGPTWLTNNVTALAQAIYTDRAFERFPILADALEDAGCDNADILNHCRQPGEHVRGCWVVDLVLDKK